MSGHDGTARPAQTPGTTASIPGRWKIFVLNLDRATDRMAHMDAMLRKLGLPYERIAAIDGSRLTAEEVKNAHADMVFRLLFGRKMSPGELGCALTHRMAYGRILSERLDWALILEDDLVLSDDLPRALAPLVEAGQGYDVLQLYYSENRPHAVVDVATAGGRRLVTFTGAHASAIAYVVHREGARKFLAFKRVFLPADKFIWMNALNKLTFCACADFLAWPHDVLNQASDIDSTDRTARHAGRVDQKNGMWKIFVRPVLLAARAMMVRTHRPDSGPHPAPIVADERRQRI